MGMVEGSSHSYILSAWFSLPPPIFTRTIWTRGQFLTKRGHCAATMEHILIYIPLLLSFPWLFRGPNASRNYMCAWRQFYSALCNQFYHYRQGTKWGLEGVVSMCGVWRLMSPEGTPEIKACIGSSTESCFLCIVYCQGVHIFIEMPSVFS
jgi:hypothetical protein